MFNLVYEIMLSLIIMLIPVIVMFISNYMILWVMMEFSFFMFVFLLMLGKNKNKNFILTYFFINFISSSLMLLSLIYIDMGFMDVGKSMIWNSVLFFSVTLKFGMFPFHWWVLNLMKIMNWYQIFLFSVPLKFIPLLIFYLYLNFSPMFIYFIMFNMIFSSLCALGVKNMKIIMCYSMINHSAFMFLLIILSCKYFLMYFLMYLEMSLMMMLIFFLGNLVKKNDFKWLGLKFNNMLCFMGIMYMMLPPMMLFMLKWIYSNMFFYMSLKYYYLILLFSLISSIIMSWSYLSLMNFYYFKNSFCKLIEFEIFKFKKIFNNYHIYILIVFMVNFFLYLYIINF